MKGVEDTSIVPVCRRIPIFSKCLLLCLQILLSSEINDSSSETALLQCFRIPFSRLKANCKYTGGICFRNLSVIRPTLVVVCDEQETSSLLVFIYMISSVCIRFKVLSKYTTDHFIAFTATFFYRSFFSRSSFSTS